MARNRAEQAYRSSGFCPQYEHPAQILPGRLKDALYVSVFIPVVQPKKPFPGPPTEWAVPRRDVLLTRSVTKEDSGSEQSRRSDGRAVTGVRSNPHDITRLLLR